jgi:hypothetical protein
MITGSDNLIKEGVTMSGKYGWHKAWKITSENQLIHGSGLRVNAVSKDGMYDLIVDKSSISKFEKHESTKIAMQPQDLENRYKRLMREAKDFWGRAQERKVKYGTPAKDAYYRQKDPANN